MVKLTQVSTAVAGAAVVALSVFALGTANVSAQEVYHGYNGHNCVDGTSASDFVATWNGKDSFTVMTKSENSVPLPVCNDVTLHASSYVLTSPDYTGGSFGATGTYPQSLYKTVDLTIAKGTTGATLSNYKYVPTTVTVPLSPCGNQQVDLYLGAEVTTVGAAGHGSQYIAGNVIQPFSTTVCEGGKGGGTTTPTPPATTPVAVAATPAAATLSDTGVNAWLTSIFAVVLLGAASVVFTRKATK